MSLFGKILQFEKLCSRFSPAGWTSRKGNSTYIDMKATLDGGSSTLINQSSNVLFSFLQHPWFFPPLFEGRRIALEGFSKQREESVSFNKTALALSGLLSLSMQLWGDLDWHWHMTVGRSMTTILKQSVTTYCVQNLTWKHGIAFSKIFSRLLKLEAFLCSCTQCCIF